MRPVSEQSSVPSPGAHWQPWASAVTLSLGDILRQLGYRVNRTLPKDGSEAMTGDLAMGGNRITGLGAATAGDDALSRDTGDDRYVNTDGDIMTGILQVVAGTAAAPGLAVGEDDTGLFRPAADTLGFAVGGSEAARINSSSQLIIGDPSESGSALFIDANVQPAIRIKADTVALETAGALRLNAGYDNGGNEPLLFQINGTEAARFAQSSGNLLIGTTTDDGSNKLQVNGVVKAPDYLVDAAAGTARQVNFNTAGSARVIFQLTSTAETGGDAGSNFSLLARDDSGGSIDSPFGFNRAGGGNVHLGGTTNRNIGLLTQSGSFGAGAKVIFIANATTAPTANPSGGYILFGDPGDGNLKVRGPMGTVTTLATP